MHNIVARAQLSPNVTRLDVVAPRIAQIRQAGQFVIVRRAEGAERIPLTIADADPEAGTITLIIQAVGKSTHELVALQPGGRSRTSSARSATPRNWSRPGGRSASAAASARPWCFRSSRASPPRRRVTSVIGGRSKEWVIFEAELRRLGEVVVCTDDGSYGRKGFVTQAAADSGGRRRGHRLCRRPGADDARGGGTDPPAGRAHDRVVEPAHGRRHRHVRRVPREHRRPDVLPAWTVPNSTGTRWISTCWPTASPPTANLSSRARRLPGGACKIGLG